MTDHYKTLQVRRDASAAVIAAAYRRLMKGAHPDHGGDTDYAAALNAAYETLSDPSLRARYDATLPTEDRHSRPLAPEIAYRIGRSIGRLVRVAHQESL
ncbi:MAG: DnaJ domain-containing protein [Coriobacteriia bacterium]|nr:DnaJ domain-containing protein [Coriobacteriia bacterium]